MGTYAVNKKWRLSHPATRLEGKKRNYALTATNNSNHGEQYTLGEDILILIFQLTDRKLHHVIGRSVQSIQARRCKLKKRRVR